MGSKKDDKDLLPKAEDSSLYKKITSLFGIFSNSDTASEKPLEETLDDPESKTKPTKPMIFHDQYGILDLMQKHLPSEDTKKKPKI